MNINPNTTTTSIPLIAVAIIAIYGMLLGFGVISYLAAPLLPVAHFAMKTSFVVSGVIVLFFGRRVSEKLYYIAIASGAASFLITKFGAIPWVLLADYGIKINKGYIDPVLTSCVCIVLVNLAGFAKKDTPRATGE